MTLDVWIDKLKENPKPENKKEKKEENNKVNKEGETEIHPFYNEFTANQPEQQRSWELENTGKLLSFLSPFSTPLLSSLASHTAFQVTDIHWAFSQITQVVSPIFLLSTFSYLSLSLLSLYLLSLPLPPSLSPLSTLKRKKKS
jgi:hypothetical protein